jgi:hypothetical protein
MPSINQLIHYQALSMPPNDTTTLRSPLCKGPDEFRLLETSITRPLLVGGARELCECLSACMSARHGKPATHHLETHADLQCGLWYVRTTRVVLRIHHNLQVVHQPSHLRAGSQLSVFLCPSDRCQGSAWRRQLTELVLLLVLLATGVCWALRAAGAGKVPAC